MEKWPLIRRYLKIGRVLFSAVYRWPSFTCQDIRCRVGKQEPPENKMADEAHQRKTSCPLEQEEGPHQETRQRGACGRTVRGHWPLRLHWERLESGSTSWAGKRQTRDCSTPAFCECSALWIFLYRLLMLGFLVHCYRRNWKRWFSGRRCVVRTYIILKTLPSFERHAPNEERTLRWSVQNNFFIVFYFFFVCFR